MMRLVAEVLKAQAWYSLVLGRLMTRYDPCMRELGIKLNFKVAKWEEFQLTTMRDLHSSSQFFIQKPSGIPSMYV